MLTRLIARSNTVAESATEYNAGIEYEYRDAEYEYEHEVDKNPGNGSRSMKYNPSLRCSPTAAGSDRSASWICFDR